MISVSPQPSSQRSGFSLMEVVIALGVFSFAIVAIMGLLVVSVDTSKSSSVDTTIASMAADVMGELRSMPFNELERLSGPALEYYFQEDGLRTPDKSGKAYYCEVVMTADDTSKGPNPAGDGLQVNLYNVVLKFSWPVGAGRAGTKEIQARIARYDYN